MRYATAFLLFLVLILFLRIVLTRDTEIVKVGDEVELFYTFLDEPRVNLRGQIFYINRVKIYAPRTPLYQYGDRIRVAGEVEEEEYLSRQNNRVINVKTLVINNPKIEAENKVFPLALMSVIRQRITSTFNRYLNSNEAGLLVGIVFGIKGSMDRDFSEMLKNTGVLHVIAASGMNVSMVGAFLLAIFLGFFKRQVALLFTILGIVFYCVLSGLDASIIRASIMAIIAFSAQILGRQGFSYLALVVTGLIMLIINPSYVRDAGFLLSFFSTFGILSIKPIIDHYLDMKSFIKKFFFADDLSTTLSAQAASLPILLFFFSSYSPFSILVNILVLWTIPFLMILGGVAAIFALIHPFLSIPFLYLSYPLLWFFEFVVRTFSQIAKPLSFPSMPITLIAGYYLLLISIILLLRKRDIS